MIGSLVVIVHTSYSGDPSSNPTEVYSFYSTKIVWK